MTRTGGDSLQELPQWNAVDAFKQLPQIRPEKIYFCRQFMSRPHIRFILSARQLGRLKLQQVGLSPKLRQAVKSQNTMNGNFDSWEFQDERLRAK